MDWKLGIYNSGFASIGVGNATLVISNKWNGFGEGWRAEERKGKGEAGGKRKRKNAHVGSLVTEVCALGLNKRQQTF